MSIYFKEIFIMFKILTDKNIYDAWLDNINYNGKFSMKSIENKLAKYKRSLDKKLLKLRNQAKDDLAEVLLADEESTHIYYMSLVYLLPEGKKLGQEDARRMLELGMGKFLATNLEKFQGLDKKIAEDIMQPEDNIHSDRPSCLRNIESFVESDRADIGEMALDYDFINAGAFINNDLDKYPGFDRSLFARDSLSYDSLTCDRILDNFGGYKGYVTLDDFAEIPEEIFYDSHCLDFIFNHLDDLCGDKDSFLNLINKVYGETVYNSVKKLFGI